MKTAQDLVAAAKQKIREITIDEAGNAIQHAGLVIDVREPDEYQQGHLSGAINIPRGMLEFRMGSTPALEARDQAIVLYCKTSGRSALAAAALQEMGYVDVVSVTGGFDAWVDAGKPVVKPDLPKFD
ncbi:MAG TPA: rhodanese-like domain-containing protein [Marinobacterium sp.]|nr:rhodanese-like domain-containing protein [Marinobacterium sp.]